MKNQLFYGDNIEVLRKYIKDESVDLCYIDPPFNSKRNYNQIYNNIGKEDTAQAQAFLDTWTWNSQAGDGFDDIILNKSGVQTVQSIELILALEKVLGKGSLLAYIVAMTQRIAEIYRTLKPTGSFYLHCDPTASHYLKLVCDALFCSRSGEFRNEIIWQRTSSHNDSKKWGAVNDVIFYYVKSSKAVWNPVFMTYSDSYLEDFYKYEDERGRYRLDHIIRTASMGLRPNLSYDYKGYLPEYGWRVVKEKLEALDEDGKLTWSSTGRPYLKRYLSEQKGVPVTTNITDISPLSAQAKERLGYPTQKPEALLERIIQASSNEGDVILDAFCGCGTTIAVAERLNRNWIGVDITYQAISLILKRLEDTFAIDFTKDVIDKDTKKVLVPAKVEVQGVPQDFASAVALANRKDDRVRKEFEKWFVLTYSNNRAIINEKKGGDEGIDGIGYILDFDAEGKQTVQKVIFSVKSGKTLTPSVVRDLYGTMTREGAVMGYLLTLYDMPNLDKEAQKYGRYENQISGKRYDAISVVNVQQLLDGARFDLPLSLAVVKSAVVKEENTTLDIFGNNA